MIGHLSRDVVAGGEPQIGGGPWHAARALRVLQADALLVAKCGAADEEAFRAELETTGVPFRLVVGERTTAFSFTYDDSGVRTMPPSVQPRFSRHATPSTRAAASASARRCSGVPFDESSPVVRSHKPTR